MKLSGLSNFCKEMIGSYPDKKEKIMEYYWLAVMEIEDGGSVEHECELAVSDIEELCS